MTSRVRNAERTDVKGKSECSKDGVKKTYFCRHFNYLHMATASVRTQERRYSLVQTGVKIFSQKLNNHTSFISLDEDIPDFTKLYF